MGAVVITARDSISDRIAGLDTGADDYLVKPFNLDELLAVVFRAEVIELSAREFAVLEALLR